MRTGKRQSTLLTSLSVLGVLALAACSSPGDGGSETGGDFSDCSSDADLVAAAQAEGRVTWYTDLPEAMITAVADAFTDACDVSVDYVRLAGGHLYQRFAAEQDAGGSEAGVLSAADTAFLNDASDQGWLTPIDESLVPNLASYPDEYLSETPYVLLAMQPIGIAYNSDLVDTPPTDWPDLLSPEYEGQILLSDPTLIAWLGLIDLLEQEYGPELIEGLAAQNFTLVESAVPATQTLAAGGASISTPNLEAVVAPLRADGAPVDIVFPSFTTGTEQFVALTSATSTPEAARLLVDFLLSEAGQAAVTGGVAASPLGDVEGAMVLPEGYVRPDWAGALEREDELRALLGL